MAKPINEYPVQINNQPMYFNIAVMVSPPLQMVENIAELQCANSGETPHT